MGNLRFGDYDDETAKQDKEEAEASGAEFVKLKVGRNIVRVLPPPSGEKKLFKVVYQHWIEAIQKSVVCARIEAKKPCLVCQHVEKLKKSEAKAMQDLAKDLFPRRRVYVNVLVRGKEEEGPKVLACGKTIHEQLLSLRNDDVSGANYSHPLEGFDIVIERTGTSKNDTKYAVRMAQRPSPLDKGGDETKMQEWIDTQPDLNAYAKLPSAEEVTAMLTEGEEEEEDAAPPQRGGGAAAGRKPQRRAQEDAIDVEAEEA